MVELIKLMVAIVLTGPTGFAVTSSPTSSIDNQLDFVSLRVGENRLQLQNGETLPILRGDKFKIERAQLVGAQLKVERVDLVGFASSKEQRDDSNRWIDSNRDLIGRFAVEGTTDKYALRVYRAGRISGESFIQIVEPTLNYATIRINDETKMVRATDVLSVKGTDQFKVQNVMTNFGEDKDVTVRIEPIEIRGKDVGFKLYEMQLIRKNVVFAKISLQVR